MNENTLVLYNIIQHWQVVIHALSIIFIGTGEVIY